ncbi:hypothetical protein FS837_004398, partial [Tulasnella sp. UAMH 9824]
MKLFAFIVLVLAYGPRLLCDVLSVPRSPAPTPVYPTKTFSDAFTARKATVQVPPTSVVVRDHNNVGESTALPITSFYGKIFSTTSTVSILTAFQVPSTLASVRDVAFALKLSHQVQMLWNGVGHWLQRDLGQLIEQIVVFYVYMWAFVVAALVLRRKRALDRPYVTTELAAHFKPTCAPLAWIEVRSVEGILLLFSYTTNSWENPDQWTGLWIPRRRYTHYLPNGPADRDADFNAAVSGLLGILLQAVSSYHPWAPQLAESLLLAGPTPLHASEPTVQPKSTAGGELCSRRRPHFRPAISRFGGPPAQVASKFFAPKREYALVDWIKISSEEGTIILYGYSTTSIGRATKWTSQYFPRHPHTYHLSNRPANFDSLLLGMLPQSISIYQPGAQKLDGVLVDTAEEVVEEVVVIASTDSEPGVETDSLLQSDSRPNTPDLPSAIDIQPNSAHHAESNPNTVLEAALPLTPLEDTDHAGGVDNHRVQASSPLTSTLLPLASRPFALNSSRIYNGNHAATQPSGYRFPEPVASASQVHRSTFGPPVGPSFSSPGTLPLFNYNTSPYQRGETVYHPYTTPSTYQHGPTVHHPNTISFGYQHTPTPYHPYATPAGYQPRPMVYQPNTFHAAYPYVPTAYHQHANQMMMPQPRTVQPVAAVRQDVRPLLPVLAERASHRQDPGSWATESTGFREEAVKGIEPEEALKKKFR